MDLAEIRKKSRLQNASQKADLQESQLLQPAPVQVDDISSARPLNKFLDSDAGFVGATEEEYAQDLQAHDIDSEGGAVQWLTFFLNDEEYALGLSDVVELVRPRHLTELPQVPDYLLGIVSLRGVIVPVIDLSLRLKLPCSDDVSQQRIIVCAMGDQQIGLQVDRVAQVVKVRRDQVEPPPMVLDANAGDFVAGVGRINGRMLVLLDPEKVMDICPLETLPV